METFNIKGVEIFSSGIWNGDKYDTNDLGKMVEAFRETKQGVRPFLKLGHDDDQKMLQKDGLPAAGWIEDIYVKGDKLLADFSDIPEKVYKLIKSKAYRKVSCEIFYNICIGEKKYQYLLGAVALLGANTPGVMNLADILSQYKNRKSEGIRVYQENALEIKTVSFSNRKDSRMEKTENEIKLELELKALKEASEKQAEEIKKFTAIKTDVEKENADLKKFKEEAEKREAILSMQAEQARIDKFVTEMASEKLVTPAMKPMITALLGPEKKEYVIKTKDKEEKKSKEDLLKESLKLFKAASEVNFVESSEDGNKDGNDDDAKIDKKAREYADKNKVSYASALKSVLKEKSE